jgi:hypothetical protein
MSAVLLSSIDGARAQFVREGRELLDRAVRSARLIRERIAAEVPELTVVGSERLAALPGVAGVDPTHVMIETASIGLSGYKAEVVVAGGYLEGATDQSLGKMRVVV